MTIKPQSFKMTMRTITKTIME